jgi:hypothetical protein
MIEEKLNQRKEPKEKERRLETELGNVNYFIKKGSANTIPRDITLKNRTSNTLNYVLQKLEQDCYKHGAHELVLDIDLDNELFQEVARQRNYGHMPGIPLTSTTTYYKNLE